MDLVCFSGDKLLGGPQAGVIVGRREAVDLCRRHPLARALRLGRLPLAALAATLALYRDPGARAVREIPVLAMLAAAPQELGSARAAGRRGDRGRGRRMRSRARAAARCRCWSCPGRRSRWTASADALAASATRRRSSGRWAASSVSRLLLDPRTLTDRGCRLEVGVLGANALAGDVKHSEPLTVGTAGHIDHGKSGAWWRR